MPSSRPQAARTPGRERAASPRKYSSGRRRWGIEPKSHPALQCVSQLGEQIGGSSSCFPMTTRATVRKRPRLPAMKGTLSWLEVVHHEPLGHSRSPEASRAVTPCRLRDSKGPWTVCGAKLHRSSDSRHRHRRRLWWRRRRIRGLWRGRLRAGLGWIDGPRVARVRSGRWGRQRRWFGWCAHVFE